MDHVDAADVLNSLVNTLFSKRYMMLPRLTIGMATYNDFDGCYFTIQSLRLYHSFPREDVELLIVDNAPQSSHSQMLGGLCGASGARYIPLHAPVGTSPSRNRVFEAAEGEFVLCMDSHVMLVPGAVQRLLDFIPEAGPHLYTGPMIMDDLSGICTHFTPQWRSEMYGIWGRAWQCLCGNMNFTCTEINGLIAYWHMPLCTSRIGGCGECGKQLPSIGWAGHESLLISQGYTSLGADRNGEKFEIPGQGLGLFGCRKDAWLHFHPHAVGFGAEELNIHELYRQRGHKCYSLPFLTWLHKFGRPNGVPYPLQRYHKVRNYVLWHLLLGKKLDDIHEHFVAPRLISVEDWEYLISDPVNHREPRPAGCCPKSQSVLLPEKIEDIYETTLKVERDFNRHMPKLRELADSCAHVTDLSIRQESFIALVASKAPTIVSYSNEHNPLTDRCADLREMKRIPALPHNITDIAPTDLLFLNTTHNYDQVYKELTTLSPKVNHYIVLHNTQIYGEMGEGSTNEKPVPGILVAARQFMREHPEWGVIYHSIEQYGLTVLSRIAEDKHQLPGKLTMIANFTKALAEHVADGSEKAPTEVVEDRLNICAGCPHRNEDRCGVCGCFINTKATWKSAACPLGYWPQLPILQ